MSSLAQVVQELLLSILGFPGDIIVCDTGVEYDIGTNDADIFRVGMFHVRDGCTAVTEAERDQINRLAPLGTYYVCFNRYCQRYFIQWKHIDQRSELHRLAVAGALQDVLNEYVDDVADLEVDYCSDTTLPLSAFVQRMQKYLICFPHLYALLKSTEETKTSGALLTDRFSQQLSGLPELNSVMYRIIQKLHGVSLKLIFSWMIYGELDRSSDGFFIKAKKSNSQWSIRHQVNTRDQVVEEAIFSSSNDGSYDCIDIRMDSEARDWSSYYLAMNLVPHSLLMSSTASKVLFAGRATLLMNHLDGDVVDGTLANSKSNDCLNYLARGAPLITTEHHSPSLNEEMIAKFDNDFQSILEGDLSDTVAALARVVDGVTDQTSSKLWRMMCGELDFFKYLFAARSVYLMGKGEMTQCILDHLFSNSWNPHMTVDAMSKSLSNEVLPSVMKLVGVEDDESVSGTLRLTVSTNSLRIERWDEFDQQSVALAGSADFTVDGLDVVETASHRAKMFLPSGVNLCALRRVPEAVVEIMMSKSYLFDGGLQSVQLEPSELGNKVINGALWLQDVRNVNKGWRLAAEFSLPWMASLKSIASKVALADADSEIVLGTVALCVHNDSRGVDAIGCNVMLGGLSNALKATAMFCAKAAGRGKIRQYVRLILSHTMEHGLPAMLRTQPSSQDIQEIVLGEETIDLSGKDRLNTTDNYRLEADCRRLLSYQSNSTAAAAVHMKGEVSYAIKMRLMQGSSSSSEWDIEKVVDAKSLIISSSGGFSVVGVVGSGAVLDIHTLNSADKRDVFIVDGEPYQQVAVFAPVVQTLSFESSGPGFGSILPHPVCSAYTSTHHPATYSAMEELVHHYQRTTSFLRTQLLFPPFLQILFDTDTCRQYERLFQLLFKVRAVGYALERLWMGASKTSSATEILDRNLSNMRHAMHFFISNLLYYFQVDVVDAEFAQLNESLKQCGEFQAALNCHRQFLTALTRLLWIDQITLQESLDRILSLCWRFIAACKLQSKSFRFGYDDCQSAAEGGEFKPPVVVPPQEFESILNEFYQQIQHLSYIMRMAESRGFLLRLDFNGFLSQLSASNFGRPKRS